MGDDAQTAAATTLSALSAGTAADLSRGMAFKDVTSAIAFVRHHALRQNKQLLDDAKTRNGMDRKLVCACAACPFFVRFRSAKRSATADLPWAIVELDPLHAPSCTSVAKPKPRELVRLDVFKAALVENPTISATKLARVLHDKSGMIVEPHTADRARRLLAPKGSATDAARQASAARSTRKRARDNETPQADSSASESDSTMTVHADDQHEGVHVEPSDPLDPLGPPPPFFQKPIHQESEAHMPNRTTSEIADEPKVDSRRPLSTLLLDFQRLNDGSITTCEYDARGRFERAFAACGVFTQASSKNQRVFGFECIETTTRLSLGRRGFHMYLLGKDANMATVVLAVAVVESFDVHVADHHEWFFQRVLDTKVDIRNGVVIAALTDELLTVGAKLDLRVKPCGRWLHEFTILRDDINHARVALEAKVAQDQMPLYGWSTRDFLPVDGDIGIQTFIQHRRSDRPIKFFVKTMEKWKFDARSRHNLCRAWLVRRFQFTPNALEMWVREWQHPCGKIVQRTASEYIVGNVLVDIDRNACACRFMTQYGIPCRHMTAVFFYRHYAYPEATFFNRFAPIYRVEAYRSVYHDKSDRVPRVAMGTEVEVERRGTIRPDGSMDQGTPADVREMSPPHKKLTHVSDFAGNDNLVATKHTAITRPQKTHSSECVFATLAEKIRLVQEQSSEHVNSLMPRGLPMNQYPDQALTTSPEAATIDKTAMARLNNTGSVVSMGARRLLGEPHPEVEYLGSKTNPVDEHTRLADWIRLKQRMELIEIETPANGSCLYFAFHAIMSNECEAAISLTDQDAVEGADGYRLRLNNLLLTYSGERTGCRTLLLPANMSSDALRDLQSRLYQAWFQSCSETAPREAWGGELQIKAMVVESGHPITVFDAQADGRVLACVYRLRLRIVVMEHLSVDAAVDFVSRLKERCVVPLVLVLHRKPGGDHFNALRLADPQIHRVWTRTEAKRMQQAAHAVVDNRNSNMYDAILANIHHLD